MRRYIRALTSGGVIGGDKFPACNDDVAVREYCTRIWVGRVNRIVSCGRGVRGAPSFEACATQFLFTLELSVAVR